MLCSKQEGVIDLIKDKPEIEVLPKQNSELGLMEQVLTDKLDIVLMGAGLFEHGGKQIMQALLSRYPEIAFLVLAPNENRELLLDAIRSGAKGYLSGVTSETALLKSLYAVERGEIAEERYRFGASAGLRKGFESRERETE